MPKPKKTAIVVRKDTNVVPIRELSDSAAVMQMIDRAARDPAVDIEKLERLQQMFERIKANTAQAEYMAALSAMQTELPMIEERGAIHKSAAKGGGVQSRYARWEDVVDAIGPVMAKHGFALTFRIENTDKLVSVTGFLSHRMGHSEKTTITLPIDTSEYRSAVQSIGSSVSYGKRYTTFALLSLRSTYSEDDDGQAGGRYEATLDDNQIANIQAMLDEGANPSESKRRFLQWAKVDHIGDILAKNYDAVVREIQARRGQRA